MEQNNHPSSFLSKELVSQLRSLSSSAEELGRLSEEQLAIIYRYKWFKLFVPKNLNGLEYSLPEALRTEEALAWIDGSLGWTVTLCSGANWFIGFLSGKEIKKQFQGEQVCLAGSGQASGIANIIDGGYELSGSWDYATGAPHATIFTAVCKIVKDGSPLLDSEGKAVTKAFWFLREEVNIIENWKSMGMKATASHRFEANKCVLPEERSFQLTPQQVQSEAAIFKYPFLQFAEATLAVNYSGMAAHFLDLSQEILQQRIMEVNSSSEKQAITQKMQLRVKQEIQSYEQSRDLFYEAIQTSWNLVEEGNKLEDEVLQQISEKSKTLAKAARAAVTAIYPYCGMSAARYGTEINRIWRDLHTASQHTVLLS